MAFCVLSRNKKTFAVSSLVLNLLASQTGDFFLPHPVVLYILIFKFLDKQTGRQTFLQQMIASIP